jgi:hypothetical protein
MMLYVRRAIPLFRISVVRARFGVRVRFRVRVKPRVLGLGLGDPLGFQQRAINPENKYTTKRERGREGKRGRTQDKTVLSALVIKDKSLLFWSGT